MRTDTRMERRRFKGWRRIAAGLGMAFLLTVLGPAQATFHLVSIVEIFGGTPASPQAQYVVLQMYAGGQNLVGGHNFVFYNASGQVVASFVMQDDVSNGSNQSRILIATPQAATFFNVQADFTMPAQLMSAGGKVCFAEGVDCVAWGAYTGSQADVGPPFNPNGGLAGGRAAARRLDVAGAPNILEAGDDTNNCANDFRFGTPAPRNNAGQVGAPPASTCGNGTIEGLEQCDDGNLANGDSCSSTCLVTTPTAPYRPRADFNVDARSDIPWRNGQTGANAIWRSGNSATQQPVTAVTNTAWRIAGVGDFDANGAADLFWRNTSTGANTIWRNANSTTQTGVATVASQAWKVVAVADFNGDARSDLAWRNDTTGANSIWLSGNAATPLAMTTVTNLQWRVVGAADFNADGRGDVLWRNMGTGANSIWLSGNSGTLRAVTTVGLAWQIAGFGDFNGDGAADLFWRNGTTGANSIWLSANSSTSVAAVGVSNQAWRVAAVADYNGDRKADLVWRNTGTGANSIWLSANAGTPAAMTGVSNQAWAIIP